MSRSHLGIKRKSEMFFSADVKRGEGGMFGRLEGRQMVGEKGGSCMFKMNKSS
jgi:hypothetical protein